MKKIKIMTVVGTRPEIIRLSRVLAKLDQYCDHILVHTGQNYDYELNEIFFKDLGIRKPDFYLNSAKGSPVLTIGNIIIDADGIMEKVRPEALLVLGDTNSCLACIPAKRRKIPIFHMEAGNRCFDQRVPEETNRKIVDHIADLNMTYSDIAREYLLREGLPADRVIKTGSPMNEVISYYQDDISKSGVIQKLGLKEEKYFVVSAHREENVDSDDHLEKLADIINEVAGQHDMPVVMSAHPRTRARFEQKNIRVHDHVRILKPLGFLDYVNLQVNAKAVLSDSGTITEESSILNFPALNIREAHERPEGMEEAAVMMTGLSVARVMQGLEILADQPRGKERLLRKVSDYAMPNVSDKVLRIILSYTDYIKRVVWRA